MSKELKEEKWENFVSRKEVEEIFTADELINIETMDDLKDALNDEATELVYKVALNKTWKNEYYRNKGKKKKINILSNIEQMKRHLLIIKLAGWIRDDNQTLNNIINILSNIEAENKFEKENVNTKITEQNYEKYISCKNQLIEIEELLKNDDIDGFWEIISEDRNICDLKGLISIIKERIKNYNKKKLKI